MSRNGETPQPLLTEAASRKFANGCCNLGSESGRAMPISWNELVANRERVPEVSSLSHLDRIANPLQQRSAHGLALQSIDMNYALDRYSPLIDVLPAKSATDPFDLSGNREKENYLSPRYSEEEKSLAQGKDNREKLLPEYSTSFTAESELPRKKDTEGFVVWSNAVFCLEAWDATSCISEDRSLDPFKSVISAGLNRATLSTSASAVAGSSTPVLSELSTEGDDQQLSHESSVGSTIHAHDQLTRHPQAQLWKNVSGNGPVLNFVEFGEGSKYKKSATKRERETCRQRGKLALTKPGIRHIHKEVEWPYPSLSLELDRQRIVRADDEAKIRAELEREIEKDLEREIKRKILLLNQRLEELHALQTHRYCKQGQKGRTYQNTDSLDGVFQSITQLDDTANIKMNKILPESCRTCRKMSTAGVCEQITTLQTQKKSTVQGPIHRKASAGLTKKAVHFSYASSPVSYWRQKATVPILSPSRLGLDSRTRDQPCSVSRLSVKDAYKDEEFTRTPHNSGKGLAKSSRNVKPEAQAQKINLKPFQSWTSVASTKKFDWVRTLRSGVSSSPRISTTGLHYGLNSSSKRALPSIKETFSGKVVRTLFPEDCLSTHSKDVSKPHKTKTSSHIPFASMKSDQNADFNRSHNNYHMAKICSQDAAQGAAAAKKISCKPGSDHMPTKGGRFRTANSGVQCITESRNELKLQNSNERTIGCMKKSTVQPVTLNIKGNSREQSFKAKKEGSTPSEKSFVEKSVRNGIKSSSNACAKKRGTKSGSPRCRTNQLLEQESCSIQTNICLDEMCRMNTARRRLKVPSDKLDEKQQKLILNCLEMERTGSPNVKNCRRTKNIRLDLDRITRPRT